MIASFSVSYTCRFGRSFQPSILPAALLALCLTGCATLRNGGAPEPAFDVERDLTELATQFQTATQISEFYKDPNVGARNSFVDGRLAIYNLRYIQFIRTLGADKQQLDAATDILMLGLNLAGTTTSAVRAKTNLAAASAGIGGGKATIDKDFYYDKTIPALVAAMNSQRKVVLLRILQGIREGLDAYPMTQAIIDLQDYYLAGTIQGALDVIQSDSSVKERSTEKEIQSLGPVTENDISERMQIRKTISGLTESDNTKLQAVLRELDPNAPPPATFKESKEKLQQYFREGRSNEKRKKIKQALSNAGITLAQ